jgi:hypothetical protein
MGGTYKKSPCSIITALDHMEKYEVLTIIFKFMCHMLLYLCFRLVEGLSIITINTSGKSESVICT